MHFLQSFETAPIDTAHDTLLARLNILNRIEGIQKSYHHIVRGELGGQKTPLLGEALSQSHQCACQAVVEDPFLEDLVGSSVPLPDLKVDALLAKQSFTRGELNCVELSRLEHLSPQLGERGLLSKLAHRALEDDSHEDCVE